MSIAESLKRGFIELNAGRYQQAAEIGRALLLKDNQLADGWFLMAMIAAANLKVAKALELLGQAIDLDPGNPEYLAQKATQKANQKMRNQISILNIEVMMMQSSI